MFDDGPQPGDVFWTPSDWSWIGALGEVALPVAFHGYPLVATAERFSVAMAYRVLAEHGITCPFLAPAVIRRMRAEPPPDPSVFRLRAVMTGGEALAPEARSFMEETFGCALNDIFGQTEANHLAAGCAARFETPPGAIGRPVPGRRIAILDRAGTELPPGSSGEIALAADDPIVMLGYWGRPDLTARRSSAVGCGSAIAGTLDADGFLRFEGRLDDLIKVSGIQVGAEEVEAALLGHPAVAEAGVCAVTRPDVGGDTVAAFVRLRPARRSNRTSCAPWCGAHRAARRAAVVEFVDAFPTTSSGKIQRRELRRIYEGGPPSREAQVDHVAARDVADVDDRAGVHGQRRPAGRVVEHDHLAVADVGERPRPQRVVAAGAGGDLDPHARCEAVLLELRAAHRQRHVAEPVDRHRGRPHVPGLEVRGGQLDLEQRRRVDGRPHLARPAAPPARCAATGANTSRPWNVRDTRFQEQRPVGDLVGRRTPPTSSAAKASRPLSGPTRRRPSTVSTTTARRSEPTPGSTTATWTPTGEYGSAWASASAPCSTACGSMPCVRCTTRASGAIRVMTASMTPAYSSRRPKSESSVTTRVMGWMVRPPARAGTVPARADGY